LLYKHIAARHASLFETLQSPFHCCQTSNIHENMIGIIRMWEKMQKPAKYIAYDGDTKSG